MTDISRDAVAYEAIQRVYRPAVTGHIRRVFEKEFGSSAAATLVRCFKPEDWESSKAAARLARSAGTVTNAPQDEFDLLDVGKLANVLETHFDLLFPADPDCDARQKAARKQAVLSFVRLIRSVRDPISHPVAAELSYGDARLAVDNARRVVRFFDADAEARLAQLLQSLQADSEKGASSADPEATDSTPAPLDAELPAPETVVRRFVGREIELSQLRDWLADLEQNRWLLAGAGGQGKSAIAYQFAREVRQRAPEGLTFVLWLSAKKRRYADGRVLMVDERDITDLPTALDRVLYGLGWLNDAPEDPAAKRGFVMKLLADFPILLILDDVDSLEGEDEGVIDFFTRVANRTNTKVLMTSRRSLLGMGSITTMVEGLPESDGLAFLETKIGEYRLDSNRFPAKVRRTILEVTEGTPLFIEDLLRLTVATTPEQAVASWRDKRGDVAREYALGREVELLSRGARGVLIASALRNGPVSFEELRLVTGLDADDLESAINELQRLFLLASPRLIEEVDRFELDRNTRMLVVHVVVSLYPDDATRLGAAWSELVSGAAARSRRGRAGEYVRQARVLSQRDRHGEAEETLLAGLRELPENPQLIAQLGIVYKMWRPQPRTTDARQRFERARDLGSCDPFMYVHWIEMERSLEQWTGAVEVGEAALMRIPGDQILRYQTGYVLWRQGRALRQQFQPKAGEVLKRASERLKSAILEPQDVMDGYARQTNAKAYRALCHSLADQVRVLRDDGIAPLDKTLLRTQAELAQVLDEWEAEQPDDTYAADVRSDVRDCLPMSRDGAE